MSPPEPQKAESLEFVNLAPGEAFRFSLGLDLSQLKNLGNVELEVTGFYHSYWTKMEEKEGMNLWHEGKGSLYSQNAIISVGD